MCARKQAQCLHFLHFYARAGAVCNNLLSPLGANPIFTRARGGVLTLGSVFASHPRGPGAVSTMVDRLPQLEKSPTRARGRCPLLWAYHPRGRKTADVLRTSASHCFSQYNSDARDSLSNYMNNRFLLFPFVAALRLMLES